MFDYENYIGDLQEIIDEELDSLPSGYDPEEYIKAEKPFIVKRRLLTKKYNIIFKHELKDAWQQPREEFYVVNTEKDNIVIHNDENNTTKTYSLPKEAINSIIDYLKKDDYLFQICDVLFPPVLDGTNHNLYVCDGNKYIEFSCANLWYWLEKGFKEKYSNSNKKEVEYTKKVIEFIKEIQNILDSNDIKYKILDE